ncbi:class I SAM-dependent methyltransferase family protein [Oscillatoria sp. FACHB-1407]|uniref:class I SAM-dependent methyltransferase family protein n=1 Tax=Oscillatoria sp. FACHB-1407 TaxID=2692847 RepID=UPI0018EFEF09|nr:class I SAM-dependent methyltransferase family protein [Oscillatoria sp. FACHB-1407]
MPKDWFEWHDLYQSDQRLQQRLEIVQEHIKTSLDNAPPGLIRIVSVCAGDGRDLLGVIPNHPRVHDIQARLVNLNPQLVERGRQAIATTGLSDQITFVNGDATYSNAYAGAVPADIVLVCGVFGNLPDEAELQRLIGNLKYLAKPDAFVLWTRSYADGIAYPEIVRKHFREANFEEIIYRLTATGDMGVGLHRYRGETAPHPLIKLYLSLQV